MVEERRKFMRYECLLPAEVLKADGKDKLVERTTVHDFSRDGLKLVIKFVSLDPGSNMKLKLYVPEKKISTSVLTEIPWRKFEENRVEVGLKIKEMEEETRNEILNWVTPRWLEVKLK